MTGNVTFAGSPVDGEIRFASGIDTDAGTITEGGYIVLVTEGSKKVEIYASRETGEEVESAVNPGPMEKAVEIYIPAKFNAESELKADVSNSGENRFDFDLTE